MLELRSQFTRAGNVGEVHRAGYMVKSRALGGTAVRPCSCVIWGSSTSLSLKFCTCEMRQLRVSASWEGEKTSTQLLELNKRVYYCYYVLLS